jgi:hypothetical protein
MDERGSTRAETSSAPDFLLEWYKLQRQHELELNKATLAYELELAKLLVLLNGGAAGAFLTLLGAVWKDASPHPSLTWTAAAIVSWLIGLFVAFLTIHQAYEIQRGYSKAYRLRRQGEELRRIKNLGVDESHLGIAGNIKEDLEKTRRDADDKSDKIWLSRYSAVAMFVLGGLFALVAFTCSNTPAAH